jgi:hypothetical protein
MSYNKVDFGLFFGNGGCATVTDVMAAPFLGRFVERWESKLFCNFGIVRLVCENCKCACFSACVN